MFCAIDVQMLTPSTFQLQTDLPQPLKRCAKCQTTTYCSRECQKADWKAHKRICASQASSHQNASSSAGSSTGAHNPGFNVMNGLLGLSNDDYLHKLSEKDVLIQLIDCFRMRMEDEYTFGANNFGIYGGESPVPVFKKFLDLAEKRDRLLPSWWNKEKRQECERLAKGGDSWADISCAVEKSDIQVHYGDGMMPMKLRILGEKIYGKGFM
jgi:splicing suppressor protein 51